MNSPQGSAASNVKEDPFMARETKVGLLAGLAFIICFAVILANRGHQPSIPDHLPYPVAQRSAVSPRPTPSSMASREPPKQPIEAPVLGSSGEPAALELQVPGFVMRQGPPNPQTGNNVSPLGHGDLRSASIDSMNTPGHAPIDPGVVLSSSSSPGRPHSFIDPSDVAGRSPTPSPNQLLAPPPSEERYTVGLGDTLSKIAARYYGSKSTNIVDAIVTANRQMISNRDSLRVGMELRLPKIGSTAPALEPVQSSPQAILASAKDPKSTAESKAISEPKPGSNASSPYRWYQVQKNDRYMSIAQTELGNRGRWKELYELNKDRFPDAEQIREGVRIKIPSPPKPAKKTAKVAEKGR